MLTNYHETKIKVILKKRKGKNYIDFSLNFKQPLLYTIYNFYRDFNL